MFTQLLIANDKWRTANEALFDCTLYKSLDVLVLLQVLSDSDEGI